MRSFPPSLMIALLAVLAPVASAQFGPLTPVYPSNTFTLAELADVDGDGILDLVTLESSVVPLSIDASWSKGSATSTFGPSQPIATYRGRIPNLTPEARSIAAGDLDGDGFVDLVIPTEFGLLRLSGGAGNQFSGPATIEPGSCSDAQIIDVDQDGDLDVAKGGFGVPAAASSLYLNDGVGGLTPVTLPGSCCYYGRPHFTDADRDGDLDIIVYTGNSSSLMYFESLGGASYAAGVSIPQLTTSPFFSMADIDQDGDDDILYAHFVDLPTGWVENVAGTFSIDHVIAVRSASISAPRAGDMDGDGDMDFVLVQDLLGTSWYANDGSVQFPIQASIDAPRPNSNFVGLADINGDRALDILITTTNPRGVYAYENLGALGADTCVANGNSTGGPAALRASGSRSAGANQFALTLYDAPNGQFAAFLVGRVGQVSTLPGSAGILCLGAPFGIFRGPGQIAQISPGGSLLMPIDLMAFPAGSGFQAVQSGDTWLFQSIFRDPTPLGVSNLSPAVAVTFIP